MKILYEDKYLLICEKPIGVESQKSSRGGEDMLSLLAKYRHERGEEDYVGLVHRLDTATGGAMIYSKRADTVGKLSALVGSEDYKKTYLTVIHGEPMQECGELCDLLYHDKTKNKSFVCDKMRAGVKQAILNYKVLDTVTRDNGEKLSLVEVQLVTGRTHQIRVQFASRKMPILGDGKYGSRDNKASMALWSHKVDFIHPKTQKSISAKSLPPDIYPWTLFGSKLTEV